jgi:chromosome segregation ATPase
MEIAEIKSALDAQRADLHTFLAKANEELKMNGEHQAETKSAIVKIDEEIRKAHARIAELESKGAVARGEAVESKGDIARQFAESEQFKNLTQGGASRARCFPGVVGAAGGGTRDHSRTCCTTHGDAGRRAR